MNPRFILLGGFLGAGKTTAIARLAKLYSRQGLKIAIVTNDQTTNLVDTHTLRSQGFDVGEVAGACFCCSFHELTSAVDQLSAAALPDVILAEPVGSCTDLVATVIRPLSAVYQRPLEIAPYGVLLKPSHGLKILRNRPNSGFSPKAAYIFLKQLEEADFLVINRIDALMATEVDEIQGLLEERFPGRPVLRMSAKTGDGFESFVDLLNLVGNYGQRALEMDYDLYAEGEAELGWLNSQVRVRSSENPFELDYCLLELIHDLAEQLDQAQAETAHLKVIGMADGHYAVTNHISRTTRPELSLSSNAKVFSADLVINARVATDPEHLEAIVRSAVDALCLKRHLLVELVSLQSFRPGRPAPNYRIPALVS